MSTKTAAIACLFLAELARVCAIKIHRIPTDKGKEYTDRLFVSRRREPTDGHEFEKLSRKLEIEHLMAKHELRRPRRGRSV
jgi:hypothetical protein